MILNRYSYQSEQIKFLPVLVPSSTDINDYLSRCFALSTVVAVRKTRINESQSTVSNYDTIVAALLLKQTPLVALQIIIQ